MSIVYYNFDMGVQKESAYKELINSDNKSYGGSG